MTLLPSMLHAVVIGLLLAGAAWCLDRTLARARLPTRWVWVAAIALTAVVPASGFIADGGEAALGERAGYSEATGAVGWLIQPVTDVAAESGSVVAWPFALLGAASAGITTGLEAAVGVLPSGPRLDTLVLALWAAGSLALLALLLQARVRMAGRRRRWPRAELRGRAVRVAPDLGPAVIGLVRPEIVVPEWAASLKGSELDLVLAHEEEHVRARDPLLLHLGLVPLCLFPWNPALWWQLRRLRDAVEVDCDRRLLRRGAAPARYGRLLVQLGTRGRTDILPAPALSASPSLLERRLNAMKKKSLKATLPAALLGAAAGLVLLAVACDMDLPMEPSSTEPTGNEGAVITLAEPPEDAVFVVDGVIVPRDLALETLEGREVESVQVIRGQAAQALYGARAQGGVVSIRTTEAEPPATDPPPGDTTTALAEEPSFTPYEVAPQVRNASEIQRALEGEYPSEMRDMGIGGTVIVHFFIDETGAVGNAVIAQASGHADLDEAAVRVARTFEFVPAQRDGAAVPVWVQIPITFQTR